MCVSCSCKEGKGVTGKGRYTTRFEKFSNAARERVEERRHFDDRGLTKE